MHYRLHALQTLKQESYPQCHVLIVYCFLAGDETTVLSATVEMTTTPTTVESTTYATVKMPGNVVYVR